MKFRAAALMALLALAPAYAFAAQVNVSIGDDFFSPKALNVNIGDTVVWTNTGSMTHTVTADNVSFISPPLGAGQTFSHTFDAAGTFQYYCQYHGGKGGVGMSGVITVQAPASTGATPSGTQTITNLQNQVQALSLYLQQLLGQKSGSSVAGPAPSAPASCGGIITLSPGSSGAAVTALQQFLARDPAVYPEGLVTGYYGTLTTAAVQRFQAKAGIVSSGDPASTGYGRVGPRTLAAMQAQCAPGQSAPAQSGGAPQSGGGTATNVGGYIQVSPVQGSKPLGVTIQATVNTTNDCGSAVYTLDFGDGSQTQDINVSAGTCQTAQQTYTHTYTASGTYSVKLSAAGHSSSATVVVQ